MKTVSPKKTEKKRILVADDHRLLREGIIQLINRQSDLTCCGEAASVEEIHTAAATLKPDLLLLDLTLRGGGDGLELIKTLKAELPELRILVLSQQNEVLFTERVLRAGAHGYVMKEEGGKVVIAAIRAVLGGDLYMSRQMSAVLLQKLLETCPRVPATGIEKLSDRELHVFQLIGAGLSTRRIAEALHLSVKTVETHRENIKHKMGLRNAEELVRAGTDWVRGGNAPSPRA